MYVSLLKKGNSKPFYQHLKGPKSCEVFRLTRPVFCLTRPGATMATDATECANILNNYFQQKFLRDHQLVSIPKKMDHGRRTNPDGVTKLLRKNYRSS